MEAEIRTDIRKLTSEELKQLLASWGEPAFRSRQIFEWIWQKSAGHFDAMTNLSLPLRLRLNQHFEFRTIREEVRQISLDGTVKTRFVLHDGHKIESVLIPVPEDNRFTVCVSTQVGCSLTCKFCATGQMKRIRNLEPAEIYDQFVLVNQQCLELFGHGLTNIVYMGMGEPLLAYSSTMESIAMLTEPWGLQLSPKRITVSTAGIAKMIRRMADDQTKVNLALSLHAADDRKREEIMPINEQNNLEVLMDAIAYFYHKTGNRISYEYIAFDKFNLGHQDALNLAMLCRRFPVKVNIIEYNPVDGTSFARASEQEVNQFARTLRQKEIMVTVRKSRGKDIDAACGQLANKDKALV